VLTTNVRWRKASGSQASTTCVEVAGTLDRIRDSKNPAGPVLRGDVKELIHALIADDFGR